MERPKHYEAKTDWIDFCYQNNITDPCVTLAGKYITRLGKKEGATITEDLRKAIDCLERALAHYEEREVKVEMYSHNCRKCLGECTCPSLRPTNLPQ